MHLIYRHANRKQALSSGLRVVSANSIIAFSLMATAIVVPEVSIAQSTGGSSGQQQLSDARQRRDKARADLESNRKYLDENRERVGTIREEMTRLTKERAELNSELIGTGEKVKQTETKMTAIEDRLGKFESQEQRLRKSLNSQHRSISRLLSAIQRMGRNPPPVMITQRSDALAMVRSAMLLARAFPKLRGEALVLSRKLNRLVALMSGIRKESEQLRAEAKTLNEQQTKLSYLMQTKRKSYGNRQVELAEVKRTVTVIGRSVKGLEELINKLEPAIARDTRIGREIEAENRRRAIAEAEARLKGEEEARKRNERQIALNVPKNPVRPPASTPGSQKPIKPVVVRPPPAGSLAPVPSVDLAPNGGAFIGGAARIGPAIPFHRAKGKLPIPAAGKLETRFGESTQFGGRSKGLMIKTRYGAQITSPADGWVVYAGKFRTYGQLLIIKAGNGYHVLLAGLSRIDVQSGQFVLAAEPVGTMKKSPGARAGKNSPRLYVEFRKDGRPIDPRPWWSADFRQKVQG